MKSIEIKFKGETWIVATNKLGDGLFMRKPSASAYQQVRGNSQFKTKASTARAFFSDVKKELYIKEADLITSMGWV